MIYLPDKELENIESIEDLKKILTKHAEIGNIWHPTFFQNWTAFACHNLLKNEKALQAYYQEILIRKFGGIK